MADMEGNIMAYLIYETETGRIAGGFFNETNALANSGNGFLVMEYDFEAYPSLELYKINNGAITPDPDLLAASIRKDRDEVLRNTVDPIVSNSLRWADLTAAKQTEWTQYRIDLLNIPDQAGFPTDITWPTKP